MTRLSLLNVKVTDKSRVNLILISTYVHYLRWIFAYCHPHDITLICHRFDLFDDFRPSSGSKTYDDDDHNDNSDIEEDTNRSSSLPLTDIKCFDIAVIQ
jgi:hypothetical protein